MKSQTVTPDIRTVRGFIQSIKAEQERKQAARPLTDALYDREHECVGAGNLDLIIWFDIPVSYQAEDIQGERCGVWIDPGSECPFVEGDIVECEVDFSNLKTYTNWARNVRAAKP